MSSKTHIIDSRVSRNFNRCTFSGSRSIKFKSFGKEMLMGQNVGFGIKHGPRHHKLNALNFHTHFLLRLLCIQWHIQHSPSRHFDRLAAHVDSNKFHFLSDSLIASSSWLYSLLVRFPFFLRPKNTRKKSSCLAAIKQHSTQCRVSKTRETIRLTLWCFFYINITEAKPQAQARELKHHPNHCPNHHLNHHKPSQSEAAQADKVFRSCCMRAFLACTQLTIAYQYS